MSFLRCLSVVLLCTAATVSFTSCRDEGSSATANAGVTKASSPKAAAQLRLLQLLPPMPEQLERTGETSFRQTWKIVGRVANATSEPIEDLEATVTWFGPDGKRISKGAAFVEMSPATYEQLDARPGITAQFTYLVDLEMERDELSLRGGLVSGSTIKLEFSGNGDDLTFEADETDASLIVDSAMVSAAPREIQPMPGNSPLAAAFNREHGFVDDAATTQQKTEETKQRMLRIAAAADRYFAAGGGDFGTGNAAEKLATNVAQADLLDAWNQPFIMASFKSHYAIVSGGADKNTQVVPHSILLGGPGQISDGVSDDMVLVKKGSTVEFLTSPSNG